jgi:hypothetical protein
MPQPSGLDMKNPSSGILTADSVRATITVVPDDYYIALGTDNNAQLNYFYYGRGTRSNIPLKKLIEKLGSMTFEEIENAEFTEDDFMDSLDFKDPNIGDFNVSYLQMKW